VGFHREVGRPTLRLTPTTLKSVSRDSKRNPGSGWVVVGVGA